LNEANRRREIEEARAREKSREQQRAARKESRPATYEITLKNAGNPGLPKPATTISSRAAELSEPAAYEAGDSVASSPPDDPVLRESERILADYVAMMHRSSSMAAAAH
jgi:hypothetical protein